MQAMQAGRHAEALQVFRAAATANPRDAEALFYGGICALEMRDTATATEFLARARKAAPQSPDVAAAHAHACIMAGDLDGAEKALQVSLRLAPGDAARLCDLGTVLQQKGKLSEAESRFRKSLEIAPDHLPAAFNLALLLNQTASNSGAAGRDHTAAHARVREARDLLAGIVQSHPGDIEAAFNLAVAHDFLGDRDAFRALAEPLEEKLKEAASAHPGNPAPLVLQGRLAMMRARPKDAVRLFEDAIRADGNDPEVWDHLGAARYEALDLVGAVTAIETAIRRGGETASRLSKLAHARLDDFDAAGAQQAFDAAVKLERDYAPALTGLGLIASEAGDFEAADRNYRAAIGADPAAGMAWTKLAEIQRLSLDDDLPRLLNLLEDDTLPAVAARNMQFAAATVLDKAGEYDAAFARFAAGNALAGSLRRFDARAFAAAIDAFISTFSPGLFSRLEGAGDPSPTPVFVLGMPRSGTTLAEQIAASHPDVFGAGECQFLPDSADFLKAATGAASAPAAVAAASPDMIADTARRHLEGLTALAPEAARIIDKMPANIRLLGLIPVLFPNAAIVHCVRGAVDTCLSCYFQNFTQQAWSHDLKDTAAYYVQYRRLMDHWHAVLPGRILDLRYEDLVADKDAQSRRLIGHLELDWTDGISDFHETGLKDGRAIKTASLWQARQPVYKTSVARWKRYEKHLGPLLEGLGEYADE